MAYSQQPAQPVVTGSWHPDHQLGVLRYHDGTAWTNHTAPLPPLSPHPGPGMSTSSNDPAFWLIPVGRSWQAVTAGYVALFALVIWPLGPVALGLGLGAVRAAKRGGGLGLGRAYFAIIVGGLVSLLLVIALVRFIVG